MTRISIVVCCRIPALQLVLCPSLTARFVVVLLLSSNNVLYSTDCQVATHLDCATEANTVVWTLRPQHPWHKLFFGLESSSRRSDALPWLPHIRRHASYSINNLAKKSNPIPQAPLSVACTESRWPLCAFLPGHTICLASEKMSAESKGRCVGWAVEMMVWCYGGQRRCVGAKNCTAQYSRTVGDYAVYHPYVV